MATRVSKLRQRVFYGVVAIAFFFVLSLTTCELFGDLDNPADPNSSNFQGYIVVDTVDDVTPMKPEDEFLFPPTLYSSKVLGPVEYNFQIASDISFTTPELSLIHDNNIFIPSAWIPSKGNGTYYFRVRAKNGTSWGGWSDGVEFVIIDPTTTNSGATTTTTIASTMTTISQYDYLNIIGNIKNLPVPDSNRIVRLLVESASYRNTPGTRISIKSGYGSFVFVNGGSPSTTELTTWTVWIENGTENGLLEPGEYYSSKQLKFSGYNPLTFPTDFDTWKIK